MAEMLAAIEAPVLVVSFSNEGYLDRDEMEQLLGGLFAGRAHVTTIETDHKRYVGAQIGIHNLRGEKVGTVSHLRNKEYLYVVSESPLSTAADSGVNRSRNVRTRRPYDGCESPAPVGRAIVDQRG
ncbi:MAG: hypothetical protein ACR2IT_07720 [Pirellulales bacterium]